MELLVACLGRRCCPCRCMTLCHTMPKRSQRGCCCRHDAAAPGETANHQDALLKCRQRDECGFQKNTLLVYCLVCAAEESTKLYNAGCMCRACSASSCDGNQVTYLSELHRESFPYYVDLLVHSGGASPTSRVRLET